MLSYFQEYILEGGLGLVIRRQTAKFYSILEKL